MDVKKRVSLIERLEIRVDNSDDTAEQHHTAHVTQDRSSSFSSGMYRDPDVKYKNHNIIYRSMLDYMLVVAT